MHEAITCTQKGVNRFLFSLVLVLISSLLITMILSNLKEYRYIGAGITATNTIDVSGEGEVFAVPDIATFSVSVRKEAKTTKEAQKNATKDMNAIISYLESEGIDEKDIKTTQYNVNPRYEWHDTECFRPTCSGRRELVGYEVSQSVQIKVRDTEMAGELLSGVTEYGANNVSGLSFEVDDNERVRADARRAAIADAKEKADLLAKDLGVELVRVVRFNESGGGNNMRFAKMLALDAVAYGEDVAPQIPVGENKTVVNVTVTYEIR